MAFAERIKNHFSESVQTNMIIAESLAEKIAEVGQSIVNSILNNKKVIICGNGDSVSSAVYFSTKLLNSFEMERPSLPAMTLSTKSGNKTSPSQLYAKQINALGNSGDAMIVISNQGNDSVLIEAVKAAQEKNINIISITGSDGGKISTMLTENDDQICIPSDRNARIHESQTIIIHCLCDVVDMYLFGA